MIILEGPDGSGKTTLKQELLERIPGLYQVPRHCDTHGPITNLTDWVDDELSRPDPLTLALYDRHALISEPIYGPTVRSTVVEGFKEGSWFLGAWYQFMKKDPIVVFCLPPLKVVKKNVVQSEQMEGVEDKTEAIWLQYHFLHARMQAEGRRVTRYDYTEGEFSKQQVGFLIELIAREKDRELKI